MWKCIEMPLKRHCHQRDYTQRIRFLPFRKYAGDWYPKLFRYELSTGNCGQIVKTGGSSRVLIGSLVVTSTDGLEISLFIATLNYKNYFLQKYFNKKTIKVPKVVSPKNKNTIL